MKSYIFKILALSLIFVLGIVSLAEATTVRIPNPLIHESFGSLLDAIITFLAFYLGPPIATIMLIVAGFYFVTAAGDPAKIEKAKEIIIWTLIGLLILFSAKGLVVLLKDVIGIQPLK